MIFPKNQNTLHLNVSLQILGDGIKLCHLCTNISSNEDVKQLMNGILFYKDFEVSQLKI